MFSRHIHWAIPFAALALVPCAGLGQQSEGVPQELNVRQAVETSRSPLSQPGLHVVITAGGSYVVPADLDEGGRLAVGRESLVLGLERVGAGGSMVGATFDHEWSQYNFSGSDAPADADGLRDFSMTRFGVNARRTLSSTNWSLFAAADVTYGVEDGASWNDGRTMGGLISVRRQVNEKFGVSLGLMAHQRLEQRAMVFPIPSFDWKITDRLSLRTAQGLTLSWQVDDRKRWQADISANFEQRDYRLNSDAAQPGGILHDRRVPLLAGLRFGPRPGTFIRVYAGVAFAQEVEFLDADGNKVSDSKLDPSPMAGIQGSVRF